MIWTIMAMAANEWAWLIVLQYLEFRSESGQLHLHCAELVYSIKLTKNEVWQIGLSYLKKLTQNNIEVTEQ